MRYSRRVQRKSPPRTRSPTFAGLVVRTADASAEAMTGRKMACGAQGGTWLKASWTRPPNIRQEASSLLTNRTSRGAAFAFPSGAPPDVLIVVFADTM